MSRHVIRDFNLSYNLKELNKLETNLNLTKLSKVMEKRLTQENIIVIIKDNYKIIVEN